MTSTALTSDAAAPPPDAAALRESAQRLRERLGRAARALSATIVGQAEVVDQVLIALTAGGHVLLEGVPGLGKTLLVRTLGQVTGLDFGRVQFTPDLMPGDITGTELLDRDSGQLRFVRGPVFTNLLLADEINRAAPRTQSALLEAMQERTVTAGGQTHTLPDPFFVLATQNPLEMEGTYPLPEAQLDRFLFKVLVPYPTDHELALIAERMTGPAAAGAERALERDDLLEGAQLVRQVTVAPHVLDYAVRLVGATHPERSPVAEVQRLVRYGASPRGALSLLLGAKVCALRAERWNVSFEDIQRVAAPALRHRVILRYEASAEGMTPDALIERILTNVKPREY